MHACKLMGLRKQAPFVVSELDPTGPAATQADVRVGDVLHCVDEAEVSGLDIKQVSAMVRGAPGTQVVLTLRYAKKSPTPPIKSPTLPSKRDL